VVFPDWGVKSSATPAPMIVPATNPDATFATVFPLSAMFHLQMGFPMIFVN
jgi:hypothetical protein